MDMPKHILNNFYLHNYFNSLFILFNHGQFEIGLCTTSPGTQNFSYFFTLSLICYVLFVAYAPMLGFKPSVAWVYLSDIQPPQNLPKLFCCKKIVRFGASVSD